MSAHHDRAPKRTGVPRALIVGAGICGPATAMALQRAGIDARVYEKYPWQSQEVGSYLTLATNGLDALRAIHAAAPVLAEAFPTPDIVFSSGTGKRLGAVRIGLTRPDGTVSCTIKRAHLQRVLHDEARRRGVPIVFGKALVAAVPTANGVRATFDDGEAAEADLLIGCDGVHSVTRRVIDPSAPSPRFVGLLNFGGYTEGVAAAPAGQWRMIFGKRAFFAYTTDQTGGAVWFANVPRHASTPEERATTTPEQWKRCLLDLFTDDVGPAASLIESGRLELAADNTHDLPTVPRWFAGPMIVIGDAAHAPSPSSGQGASMAFEDAVVLAQCLRDSHDSQSAFAAFERLRRRRVERIVAQGARTSSSKAAGPLGRVLRDLMMPFVFKHLVTPSSLEWMYGHHITWEARPA
jgi:2-polyprenyl-6-methoxyphenol hydroxylase-like FAD-dependent oxidoreductase